MPTTPKFLECLPHSRKRRGKVARLPKPIRDQVNAMLDNGLPYAAICKWLADNGYPAIVKQNLHRWKAGGYQEWCAESERLQNHALNRQWLTEELSKGQPGELARALDHLFLSRTLDTLFHTDSTPLTKPRDLIAMFNAFNRLKQNWVPKRHG